jgi:hypothetical protein
MRRVVVADGESSCKFVKGAVWVKENAVGNKIIIIVLNR